MFSKGVELYDRSTLTGLQQFSEANWEYETIRPKLMIKVHNIMPLSCSKLKKIIVCSMTAKSNQNITRLFILYFRAVGISSFEDDIASCDVRCMQYKLTSVVTA